jgi:hypothetical protein
MVHYDPAEQMLVDEQAENHAAIMLMSKCDSTYRSEYKRYCKWVQNEAALVTPEAPFLSRNNVDHYFTRVISRRAGLVNGMTRVVNALEWHAAKVEHVGAIPAFVVRSPLVESALVLQKVFNVENGGTANPGSDPHKGLKDILPESSQLTYMRHIYGERDDWRSSGLNFTLGMQGAIRTASVTKFTYSNLNMSHGFGPEQSGANSRALLFVIQKGAVHKDRHETDKQVCTWRHKEWLLCSNFSTAANVISQISADEVIDFRQLNKNVRASWWGTPLIDWTKYNGESSVVVCIAKSIKLCFALYMTNFLPGSRTKRRLIPQRRYTKQLVLRTQKCVITAPRACKRLGFAACDRTKLTR